MDYARARRFPVHRAMHLLICAQSRQPFGRDNTPQYYTAMMAGLIQNA